MTANVTIEVARRDDVIRVANAALRFRPGPGPEAQVWRLDDGQLTAVPVESGLSDAQNTEIVEGELTPGETIVTRQSVMGQETRPQTAASPFQMMQPPGGGGRRTGG
jgi:HlyD family secretion protein